MPPSPAVIDQPSLRDTLFGRILPNARHEKMAQGLAVGKKQGTAYREAGFKANSASAAKLANSEIIKKRVLELQQIAVSQTTLTIEKVLAEMEKIGFANMLDYIKIDAGGQPQLDFSALTREQAAAIGEITTDEIVNSRDGTVTRRTKFKLLDKKGTLVDLGRYLGMFIDRKDIRVGGVMFHINKDDSNL